MFQGLEHGERTAELASGFKIRNCLVQDAARRPDAICGNRDMEMRRESAEPSFGHCPARDDGGVVKL